MKQKPIPKAPIKEIEPASAFDDAGFYPGCFILEVDHHPLRDIIDWRWYSAVDELTVRYEEPSGEIGETLVIRDPDQGWGVTFDGAIFEPIIQCRNACTFCFMRQLPEDARETLMIRDDDYRLSFLQGTFVTFTNFTVEDELRVIEQHISPLRFSLHAHDPEVRRQIIGKHAQHGIDVAERLMNAGIHMHAQIVLMPGINDGAILRDTLDWAYAMPGIDGVGIVPLGYTKHQKRFEESFNVPAKAQELINDILPYQIRAMEERGNPFVFASDEFYRNAYPTDLLDYLPPSEWYGDFDLFEDGIGIIRSYVDDWQTCLSEQSEVAQVLASLGRRIQFIAGEAQREFFTPLIDSSPLKGYIVPCYVKNEYFGGNVDVTGLLVGEDIIRAINTDTRPHDVVVIPEVIFNSDGVTLDNMSLDEIRQATRKEVFIVSCQTSEYLRDILRIMRDEG